MDNRTLDDVPDWEMLTVPEVAELLRYSPDVIYESIHRHEIPCIRIGRKIRVPAFGLKQWLMQQMNLPPTTAPDGRFEH